MRLIIASNNKGKVAEIKALLHGCFDDVLSLRDAGIAIDVEEDGETFEQNARIKAMAIRSVSPDCAVLSDDSGLCVDALNGAPGVYSARFSGGGDSANNQKLLEVMADVPAGKRGARFVCCACLLLPGLPEIVSFGSCSGLISFAPAGQGGFGYDPLFVCDGFGGRTFAQLTADEKNQVSHRARALQSLRNELINP